MTSLTRAVLLLFACFAGVAPVSADRQAEKPRVKVEFRRAELTLVQETAGKTVGGSTFALRVFWRSINSSLGSGTSR